jgi:hypothetical protein
VEELVIIFSPAILPVGLLLFNLTDLNISVSDTRLPDNKIATSQTEARNSCAVDMTMIGRIIPCGEGGSNG